MANDPHKKEIRGNSVHVARVPAAGSLPNKQMQEVNRTVSAPANKPAAKSVVNRTTAAKGSLPNKIGAVPLQARVPAVKGKAYPNSPSKTPVNRTVSATGKVGGVSKKEVNTEKSNIPSYSMTKGKTSAQLVAAKRTIGKPLATAKNPKPVEKATRASKDITVPNRKK